MRSTFHLAHHVTCVLHKVGAQQGRKTPPSLKPANATTRVVRLIPQAALRNADGPQEVPCQPFQYFFKMICYVHSLFSS